MLFQPSNISPSTLSGIGAGTVDAAKGINVSSLIDIIFKLKLPSTKLIFTFLRIVTCPVLFLCQLDPECLASSVLYFTGCNM